MRVIIGSNGAPEDPGLAAVFDDAGDVAGVVFDLDGLVRLFEARGWYVATLRLIEGRLVIGPHEGGLSSGAARSMTLPSAERHES